jgi:3-dehydroquinate synthetase
VLQRHGLPVSAPGLDAEAVLAAMRHDKKRAAGEHRMVLLQAIGRPVYGVGVHEEELADAVRAATAGGARTS